MNRSFFLFPLLCLPALFSACQTQNANVEVVGVPQWIANGAKLSGEPEPVRPDPAIMHHDSESGPIELRIITDRRNYPDPPKKRRTKKTSSGSDPLERGREYRIRRLFY